MDNTRKIKKKLVGKGGFEPPTSCSRSMRANQAALLPEHFKLHYEPKSVYCFFKFSEFPIQTVCVAAKPVKTIGIISEYSKIITPVPAINGVGSKVEPTRSIMMSPVLVPMRALSEI